MTSNGHRSIVGVVCVSVVTLVVSCSDDARPPASGGDGTTTIGRGPSPAPNGPTQSPAPDDTNPPTGDPACAERPREGTDVSNARIAEAAPNAKGGAIEPGKYVLTRFDEYVGASGESGTTGHSFRSTLEVAGDRLTFVSYAACHPSENNALPVTTERFAVAGTTLTSEEVCPLATRPRTRSFTSEAGVLTLYEDFGSFVRRLEYVKQ